MTDPNDQTWQTVTAIWGSVAGTIALGWDFYKWRTSGPKCVLGAAAGWKVLNDPQISQEGIYTSVTIENRSDKPTTIKHIGIRRYKNLISRIFRLNSGKQDFAAIPVTNKPLPYKIDSGEIWQGLISEKETDSQRIQLEEIWVFFSHSNRPLRSFVKPNKNKPVQSA